MRLALCSVLCSLCAPTFGQGAAEYVCHWAREAPVIDGDLGDACWADAQEPPVFFQTGVAAGPARNRTQARLMMDEGALYLGVDATTAPGRPPSARQRPRDGKTWSDDSIELFLATSFVDDSYYHLTVNALGSRMDARHAPDVPPDQQMAWNPDWELATRSNVGGWQAEARIPWAAFSLSAAPSQGWVWRIKLGCMARGYQNSMWPHNESNSFHNRNCWGYLVFRDRNLLTNPGFEQGIPDHGPPPGWLYAYYDQEGRGKCSVTTEDAASGKFAGKLEKFDDYKWFPVFYTRMLPVQAGSTYELAATVKCDQEFRMRYNLAGKQGGKRGAPVPATDGWQKVRMEATIPETGVDSLQLGFQLIRTKGLLRLDDAVVRRMNEVRGTVATLPTPHPYHRLEELANRTAFKPYDLLQADDGHYQSDRVIFKDSGTGADIWMLTRSAGTSTRHYYMEITPWNANGSLLAFHTGQLGKGTVLMPADASRWRKLPFYASGAIWDRRLPERIYFRRYRGHRKTDLWDLAIGNVLTGQYETTRRFDGDLSLWPMSQDGEKLLVQELLVGDDGRRFSRIWLMDREGKEGVALDPKGWVHQTWFTKLGDYSVEFEYEGQKPAGQYMITADNRLRKICDQTYGHRAHSPDGNWIAIIGPCAIRNIHTNELRVISSEGSNHQTWEVSNDWYATSGGRYLKRVIALGSPTVQRLGAHNSRLKHSTYWSEAHPEMSPDGTKLGFASSMLGDIEFYFLVMRKPDPPQQLTAQQRGDGIHLKWRPGAHHRETAGYLVYCSEQSGYGGEQITPEPITATEYQLSPRAIMQRRKDNKLGPVFLRVTAVEHSGLESLPSNEVISVSERPAPRSLYFEAESGAYKAPAVEVFDPTAAGLYAVTLGKLRKASPMTIRVRAPAYQTRQHLWVRARGRAPASLSATCGKLSFGRVRVEADQWQWLRFGQTVRPRTGLPEQLSLEVSAPGVTIDRVLLTGDAEYRPTGLGGLDEEPPTVSGLTAAAVGSYAARLAWPPCEAPDLSHYNVYCGDAQTFTPSQEHLIASPPGPPYTDWGLKAGTQYFYRVTAVDRSGNEGPPTEVAAVRTAALEPRVFVSLDLQWNTTKAPAIELPFSLEADTRFVLWGKVQSLDGNRSARIGVSLDGQDLGRHSIAFSYICVGHGGPVLDTWLWDCFRPGRTKPDDPMAYRAQAGKHTLTLTAADNVKVLWDGFIVTNDLGFEPAGIIDFLVRPQSH